MPAPMSVPPGTRLGPYEILAPLGAGGMGEVYRAHDTRLDRDVALKLLPEEFAHDSDRRRRFLREARAASALNHPNIVTVHDVNVDQDTPFLVTELVDGGSLRREMRSGPMSVRRVLDVGAQIASGLAAAHAAGIVHRDVKPDNVMVGRDGRARLVDFGLAQHDPLDAHDAATQTGTARGVLLGTVPYMSPEQTRGELTDFRADQFALGVMLHETLTGTHPFRRATSVQTLAAIVQDEAPSLDREAQDVPAPLRWIVERCLSKDPAGRYASTTDLARDLETLRSRASELSRQVTAPITPAARRRRAAAAVAVALTAILLVAMVLWNGGGAASPPSRDLVRLTMAMPAGLMLSRSRSVAFSPDGTYIAFIATVGDQQQLLRRQLDEYTPVVVGGTLRAEMPFVSPAGDWIGFAADGKLRKVSFAGGAPLELADAPSPSGADWGDDNTILFAPSRGPLWRVSGSGGEPRQATVLDEAGQEIAHRWPQVLPAGRAWLYFAGSRLPDRRGLKIHIPSRQETRMLVPGAVDGRYVGNGVLVFVRDGGLFAAAFDEDRLTVTGDAIPVEDPLPTGGSAVLSVSRTGALAYLRGADPAARTLVWVDRSGRSEPVGGARPGAYKFPRLSPDDRRIAMIIGARAAAQDLWTYDVRTQVARRLTTDRSSAGTVAWSPDSRRLLFTTRSAGTDNLFLQNADGSGEAERLLPANRPQFAGSWLKDGDRITFMDADSIAVMRLSDRKPATIVDAPGNQFGARVSSDERWLAYVSDESGRWEAYVTTTAQPGPRWQVSMAGGQEVVWSRDGRELYFRQGRWMMAVAFDPLADPPVGRAVPLFEDRYLFETGNPGLPHYDVGLDGRFLMIASESPAGSEISVVLNWVPHLARRLAAR